MKLNGQVKMTNNIILPYSPEWFQLRKGCFTASEIWKIMTEPRSKKDQFSKTAETYILEKVHEFLSNEVKSGVDNYATQWGVEYEPLALKWYGKKTGFALIDPYLVFHESIEGFSCTPDCFVEETLHTAEISKGLVEVKCPAKGANHLEHCIISSPEFFKQHHPEYYWQIMAQMNITKTEWCDFVSFDPRINSDLGLFIYRLQYDPEAGEFMEEKVKLARELYSSYLQTFKALSLSE